MNGWSQRLTSPAFDRGALGWEWGDKPKEFFAAIKAGIKKAKKMIDKVKKPIKKVINTGAAAIDAITSW